MKIKSKLHDYNVEFKEIKDIDFTKYDYILCSETVHSKWFKDYQQKFDDIYSANEETKTIETALEIARKFKEYGLNKSSRVLCIGGGYLQDLVSFVCAIYYRQIPWDFMPTTVLAMADSCIGGKMGLNFMGHKNLLGSFYPPNNIFICHEFTKTLSERDVLSGLGEIVKIYFMEGLEFHQSHDLAVMIQNAITLKKKYVELDEFDHGIRKHLNYGHTEGHALEVTSDYNIPHGTSVAIGMAIANNMSLFRKLITLEKEQELRLIIKNLIQMKLNKEWFEPQKLIEAARCDKKRLVPNLIKTVLLTHNGDATKMVLTDILDIDLEMALHKFKEDFSEKFTA